jgi:hypothetical protein
MTVQTIKIGRREFILLDRRDFDRLAAQAQRQSEDDYWTRAALRAESRARARNEKPVPFEAVERELDARGRGRNGDRAARRGRAR